MLKFFFLFQQHQCSAHCLQLLCIFFPSLTCSSTKCHRFLVHLQTKRFADPWLGTTWLSLWKQTFRDFNAINVRLQTNKRTNERQNIIYWLKASFTRATIRHLATIFLSIPLIAAYVPMSHRMPFIFISFHYIFFYHFCFAHFDVTFSFTSFEKKRILHRLA